MFDPNLICDRCNKDFAARIKLAFRVNSLGKPHDEIFDICADCIMNMLIRLIDRLPSEEKIPFVQTFMDGVIQ